MSWTPDLLEDYYPTGSYWRHKTGLVVVEGAHISVYGYVRVLCSSLDYGSTFTVDANADPPELDGPLSALELLGEQAE